MKILIHGQVIITDEKLLEEQMKSMCINNLKSYIYTSYGELRYIPLDDGRGNIFQESIYNNQDFEKLRYLEYNLQAINLDDLYTRMMIDEGRRKLTFQEKSYILTDISQKKFYKENAEIEINKSIKKLEKIHEETEEPNYKTKINKLYEQKYVSYYSYLNSIYNGILQKNDDGKLGYVAKCIENDMTGWVLQMDSYDIEQNINERISENEIVLKQIIKEIYGKEKTIVDKKKKEKVDIER